MWGDKGLWKTPGINLWFHIYVHPCGHVYTHACMPHTNTRALESRYTPTNYDITDDIIVWELSPECDLSPMEKSSFEAWLLTPGVWGQIIQTHFSFVSDKQEAKSENREGGNGHLESSYYLIIRIKQHEPRRKENSRNTDVCKKVLEVSRI